MQESSRLAGSVASEERKSIPQTKVLASKGPMSTKATLAPTQPSSGDSSTQNSPFKNGLESKFVPKSGVANQVLYPNNHSRSLISGISIVEDDELEQES